MCFDSYALLQVRRHGYTAGVLTKEQTVDALKIKKLYNQLVLTSEKALAFLKFVGTVPKEEL